MYKILLATFLLFINYPLQSLAQQSIQPLLDSLNVILEKEHIPGAMISIVKSDSIIFTGGIGLANIEKQEKATANHLFRLGSVSKSFTAIALYQLVESGQLQLTTPILQIDPNIPLENDWSASHPINTAHLLEHTAGFDDMHLHALYNRSDSTTPPCIQMVESHRNSLTARWCPGTRMTYSNPGYVVAGHILEVVSQQPYTKFVQDNLLHPLGMQQSGFYFKEPSALPMAQGYKYEGKEFQAIDFAAIQGGPAGEFCSNAKEMAYYLQFMLINKVKGDSSGQQILSPEAFDRIEYAQTTIAARKGFKGGYGLGNYNSWKYGFPFHGHGGAIDGFAANYIYSRKADIGIAVALNKQGSTRSLINKILAHFFEEPNTAPPNRQTFPIPAELKADYEGFYNFNYNRNQLFSFLRAMLNGVNLHFQEDTLLVSNLFGEPRDTLFYAGDQQFYSGKEGIPFAILFENEAEGNQKVVCLGDDYGEKSSKVWTIFKNMLFLSAILLTLLFLLYGFIWWIVQFFTKEKQSKISRLILWLAALSFVSMIGFFIYCVEDIPTAGTMYAGTILLFISSLAFFIFAIGSLFLCFRLKGEADLFKIYYYITTLAVVGLAIFFLWNDFIGLQLWNY